MNDGIRILIAEDDPVSRHVLSAILAQWGYETIITTNGNEAWQAIQDEQPDMAILDWMMPERDGPEICSEVRKRENAKYIYLILLTAKSQADDIVTGLEAGADDYVVKPFNRAELKSRISVGERVIALEKALASRIESLENALAEIKTLTGLLPICMYCKKIRDDKNYWQKVEVFVASRSDVKFSHAICPTCMEKYFPEEPDEDAPKEIESDSP